VNATEEELRRVSGIGAKKAREMHRVLKAEYESVDTERHLEDAIEAAPELLFGQPVTLLARQHPIYTEEQERHIVDLVFLDREADELILVELKRGKLMSEHYDQLRRYLDHAHQSGLLRTFLEKGIGMRGVLATVEECSFRPKDGDVSVCIVNREQIIEVLRQLRRHRLEHLGYA
jgi:RecB family endonuclease NucS